MIPALETLSNSELLQTLAKLVCRDRNIEADLLAHLGEVDSRRLYAAEGFPSLFKYCIEVLQFSEATAFYRIRAARLGRTYPIVLERVRRGELQLAGVTVLAAHLTPENHLELLDRARHKSKLEIEEFLANRAPKPEVRAAVWKLPRTRKVRGVPSPPLATSMVPAPAPRSNSRAPEPLGEKRFKIQFTASQALCDKLREVQALLRHQIPDGDLAEVFGRALTLLGDEARRKKFAETSRPRRSVTRKVRTKGASRHIPAEIKRAVVVRDGHRCAFVTESGRRCGSADLLEYHHVEPWVRSRYHSVVGTELRCREHNLYAAEQDFGPDHMARFRERSGAPSRDSAREESEFAPHLAGHASPVRVEADPRPGLGGP